MIRTRSCRVSVERRFSLEKEESQSMQSQFLDANKLLDLVVKQLVKLTSTIECKCDLLASMHVCVANVFRISIQTVCEQCCEISLIWLY